MATINPTNEEEITSVYAADVADVDAAVGAARAAFESPTWTELTPEARGRLLYKLADLIEENSKILATIGTAPCADFTRLSTDTVVQILGSSTTLRLVTCIVILIEMISTGTTVNLTVSVLQKTCLSRLVY